MLFNQLTIDHTIMTKFKLLTGIFLLFASIAFTQASCNQMPKHFDSSAKYNYVNLAENLLYNVRTNEPYHDMLEGLEHADENTLLNQLNSDEKRKAFWLNIYNAFIQLKLKISPEQYKDRNSFFSKDLITIAGHALSFDDIENGILRHSKIKISMGYLGKIFVGDFEKKFRVDTLDYRIHFALNCGAKSCPPIAYYSADKIDMQLNLAASSFLMNECKIKGNEVSVPKILSWFNGDFGGKSGVISMLKKFKVIPVNMQPEIKYLDYNWQMTLGSFED